MGLRFLLGLYIIKYKIDRERHGSAVEKMELKARAKINLGLDVVRRLENGYHEVNMIMQTIDLYDELTFKKRKEPDIILSVDNDELSVSDNLIIRAAKMMREQYSIKEGIEISLKKNIPIAAGMAGGSTDAAATIIAMNELFELHATKEELCKKAVRIGADVPFCIMGGTALSKGIGEVLTPIDTPPQAYLLIAKPPINVSTKFVYENLHVESIEHHPDIDAVLADIKEQNLDGMCEHIENILETVTIPNHPVIAQIKEFMEQNGAKKALMSGSGPTVFGIYDQKEDAEKAAKLLKESKLAKQIFVTTFA